MSAGDENRADFPETVALLEDARQRRDQRGRGRDETPDFGASPPAGEFDERRSAYSNADLLDELGAAQSPDQILERFDAELAGDARPAGASEQSGFNAKSVDDSGLPGLQGGRSAAPLSADDAIRVAIERHHQRDARDQPAQEPRGSADLPRIESGRTHRFPEARGQAGRRPGRRRILLGLASAGVVAAVAVIALATVSSEGHARPGRTVTAAAVQHLSAAGFNVGAIDANGAAVTQKLLHGRATSRALASNSRHRVVRGVRKPPAKRPTRPQSRSAPPRQSAQTGTQAVSVTQSTPTTVSDEPTSPSAGSAASATHTSSGSAAHALPAGPAGPGSAGSNCNPKCS